MTVRNLISSVLDDHHHWWGAMGLLIEAEDWTRLKPVATASGATVGLAAALAWVAREYPDRADELARIVQHYIDNGGDDADLLSAYDNQLAEPAAGHPRVAVGGGAEVRVRPERGAS